MNNPFEGKAIKFDKKEQLEHLVDLAKGYGLGVGSITNEVTCGYFRITANIAYDYYTNCYTANNLPEIHYSDFVASIEAVKSNHSEKHLDMVNHPKHYNVEGFEVIDIITAFGLNFPMGNALKYLLRADRKGNKVEDLKKAIWYLQYEIEQTEKQTKLAECQEEKK